MSTYVLTPERRAAYAALFDFRSQFVKAARQILTAGGITETFGPGDGVTKMKRFATSVDFVRGAAIADRKGQVILGDYRYREYSRFYGTLSIMNVVAIENEQRDPDAAFTLDHQRTLDALTSTQHALFMEHLEPFTAELLPWLDVQEIVPIEPDERPEEQREVNVAYMRWRVKFEIRPTAWPSV